MLKPLYLCEECGKPASFGFGCLAGHSGKWYCATLGQQPACKASGSPVAVAVAALPDEAPWRPAQAPPDLFKG